MRFPATAAEPDGRFVATGARSRFALCAAPAAKKEEKPEEPAVTEEEAAAGLSALFG